jgi:biopolymer transport protein ExbD
MITRPLDLASKLRPESRNFDFLFLINAGLIVLFFDLFGSRFVLAPGLTEDFRLPTMSGVREGAAPTTHTINLGRGGLIFINGGAVGLPRLREWLAAEAKTTKQPSLGVLADAQTSYGELVAVRSAAYDAGFVRVVWSAADPSAIAGAKK